MHILHITKPQGVTHLGISILGLSSFCNSLSPKDSVGWELGKGKVDFVPVSLCSVSKTALTKMFVWVCMHACVLTTDVHTPGHRACFSLWSCDKWLEF